MSVFIERKELIIEAIANQRIIVITPEFGEKFKIEPHAMYVSMRNLGKAFVYDFYLPDEENVKTLPIFVENSQATYELSEESFQPRKEYQDTNEKCYEMVIHITDKTNC